MPSIKSQAILPPSIRPPSSHLFPTSSPPTTIPTFPKQSDVVEAACPSTSSTTSSPPSPPPALPLPRAASPPAPTAARLLPPGSTLPTPPLPSPPVPYLRLGVQLGPGSTRTRPAEPKIQQYSNLPLSNLNPKYWGLTRPDLKSDRVRVAVNPARDNPNPLDFSPLPDFSPLAHRPLAHSPVAHLPFLNPSSRQPSRPATRESRLCLPFVATARRHDFVGPRGAARSFRSSPVSNEIPGIPISQTSPALPDLGVLQCWELGEPEEPQATSPLQLLVRTGILGVGWLLLHLPFQFLPGPDPFK